MNKETSCISPEASISTRKTTVLLNRFARVSSTTVLLVALSLRPAYSPRAQRAGQPPVNIQDVSAKPAHGGTVVSVSADGPLNRVQTWTDGEGFHATVPYAQRAGLRNLPPGVKVRQVGRSLELVVQTKPGANVTVEPMNNRLDLVVRGGVDTSRRADDDEPAPQQRAQREERAVARHIERAQERPSAASSAHTQRESRSATPVLQAQSASQSQSQNQRLQPAQATPRNSAAVQNSQALTQQGNQPPASAQPADQQLLVAANQGSASQTANNVAGENAGAPATTTPDTSAEGGFFSWVFSWTSMVLLLLVGIVSFFVVRKRRRAADEFWPEEETKGLTAGAKAKVSAEAESGSRNARAVEQGQGAERRRSGRRSSDQQATAQSNGRSGQNESQEQALDVRAPSTPELFGAYRVDQEVNKMILGQPHRSDVLASRSSDDRRAIETSLIKCMMDDELGEDARERARQALEDYGFVARESAALLLAHSAVDRVSAARTLGEVGSPAALPFLLEALYDSEPIVRTQAVNSLGELKQPAAIGALLDLAWRHPEIPAPLLSRVLSACSLECEQVLGGLTFEQDTPRERRLDVFTGEITGFEPATDIEALPDWLEDEEMEEALSRLESTDVEARTAAARSLAQFQVQRAVDALALMATRDTESTVRSTAVSSLGSIGHESVFAPVIIAFADEAREVRAAAARSLSRLGFDRADAYVRLAESPNMEILQQVARACIKGGMVSQALDRLASEDRRQAYEAFSLLSILARANEVEPILDAIEHHGSMEVRLNAVRLLGMAGQPQLLQQLRHLAVRDNVPEKVRTALLEVVYKIDQMQPA